jgi:hypothetical protein
VHGNEKMKFMKKDLKKGLVILLATLVGYITMGLLITVVQEWIFGGVSFNKSSFTVLTIAGTGTFLSAIIGGWLAFAFNSYTTKTSNIIMSVIVIVETTWILVTFKATSPLWFDVLAALSLIIGILIPTLFNFFRVTLSKIKSR